MRRVPFLVLVALAAACQGDDGTPDDTDTVPVDTDTVGDTEPADTEPAVDTDTDPPVVQPMDVTLTPAAPVDGDALACTADTTQVVAWSWTVDGVDAGIGAAEVPAGRARAHEVWTCRGETVDGLKAGEASAEIAELCRSYERSGAPPQPIFVEDANGRTALRAVDDAFTIEAWVLRDRTGVAQDLVVHRQGTSIDFILRFTADERLEFVTSGQPDALCGTLDGPAPAAGGWHHVAASWNPAPPESGRKRLYVDGVLVDTCVSTDRPQSQVKGYLSLGATVAVALPPASPFKNPFSGWIDEVRMSDGTIYTANFTPETFLRPTSATQLLLHLDRTEQVTVGGETVTVTPDDSANGWDARVPDGVGLTDAHSTCTPAETVEVLVDTDVPVP